MSSKYMQNREVSWLRFNERVLDEAGFDNVMPLEKLKFVSIFTSNLTEFFMVRIGSLTDLSRLKKEFKDNKTGMSTGEQIATVLSMLPNMYKKRDKLFNEISKELINFGIENKKIEDLKTDDFEYVEKFFKNEILPLASPQIIDTSHPFPFLENDKLYIFLEMKEDKRTLYGLIPVRPDFPEFVVLPNSSKINIVLTEKIILHFADTIFTGFNIINKAIINITRNFDIVDDNEIRDEFGDYKNYMKGVIKRRKRQQAVRLESNSMLSKNMQAFLAEKLKLPEANFFVSVAPLKLNYVFALEEYIPTAIKEKISNKPFTPFYKWQKEFNKSMMSLIEQRDMMLYYPYDDMKVFLDLIKEASSDPRVVSIKITIYRLAKNSKLVKYLCNASENGKEVTVFMELQARFDEENNINYSDILYESGCNILYGFEKFKTHSKLCLITYKDKNEVKYITQVGTGNYNEATSKLYTDLSLMTGNKELGLDAGDFFKNLATGNISGKYVHLLQAPHGLKSKLMELMHAEEKKGSDGLILLKMNSLTDKDIIEKLKDCSQAGVQIKMILRGISCLLPGVKDYTEHIEIHSIVGRFLEHARIYIFGKGSEKKYYISSADMMTRNMERRVEVAVPIYDKKIQTELDEYFNIQFRDNIKGRRMDNTGNYTFIKDDDTQFSSQDYFMELTNKEQMKLSKPTQKLKKNNLNKFLKKIFKLK